MHIQSSRIPWTFRRILPILFVFGIIVYEYLAFVTVVLKHLLSVDIISGIIIIIEFHPFIIMLLWLYIKVITTPPGYIPLNINDYFSNVEELKKRKLADKNSIQTKRKEKNDHKEQINVQHNMLIELNTPDSNSMSDDCFKQSNKTKQKTETEFSPISEFEAPSPTGNDSPNKPNALCKTKELSYCSKCDRIKYPRAHHCKECKTCVLRMDHHCPWIGNCVGLYNHKFFILFLFYTTTALFNVVFVIILYYLFEINPKFMHEISIEEKTHIQVNGISSLLLMLVIGFLGCFQIHCASRNITTIEYNIEEMHTKNPYAKKTFLENLSDIFGTDIKYWILPTVPDIHKEDEELNRFQTQGVTQSQRKNIKVVIINGLFFDLA